MPPRSGAGSALVAVGVVDVVVVDVEVLAVVGVLAGVGVGEPAAGQGQGDGEGGGEAQVAGGASESRGVALDEPAVAVGLVAGVLGGDDRGGLPARSAAGAGWLDGRVPGGVEHDPGDVDEGVGAVGVDGDPLAGPGLPVALELGRVLGVVAEQRRRRGARSWSRPSSRSRRRAR